MSRFALISLWDKSGGEELVKGLFALDFTIISTGKTAEYVRQFGDRVIEIPELTGFPEILDGRVKSLHPVIYGGILANRSNPEHLQTLTEHGIKAIDLVAVNLYPFEQKLNEPGLGHDELLEFIDVGGPSLLRAAAKNYASVMVLTDSDDYHASLELLGRPGADSDHWRRYLAAKAFSLVSRYDALISRYLDTSAQRSGKAFELPRSIALDLPLDRVLRYGENPHQKAGFYCAEQPAWQLLHGKELSYNNLLDLNSAFKSIRLFDPPAAVILKHGNACGIGTDPCLCEAYNKAFLTDTVSPFGGIVIVNRELDLQTAVYINKIFTEVIIAPSYAAGVLEILRKKKDRRLIQYNLQIMKFPYPPVEIRTLRFGYLAQEWDLMDDDSDKYRIVTNRRPTKAEFEALTFAWKAVSLVKSNAIALTGIDRTFGLGMGQPSRIDSTNIAISKAIQFKHDLCGAVCASDGFFPFRDSVDQLYQHGVKAIIQPGGSVGDDDVIKACNELGITMVFTDRRHFRH
ncbi:MAG: bifunctional phosphoribosylaminoimidazolecarboxamide formyltransferase/IMP cyclohydrolase [Candidatus Cloacimonetes bacterium]|nr:bifunctional phosphoribosylaminoimidazolecarboxamide formyltransferase/IMP cyclohydrolase [Candidatus Cloacimonadota bacterium]